VIIVIKKRKAYSSVRNILSKRHSAVQSTIMGTIEFNIYMYIKYFRTKLTTQNCKPEGNKLRNN